MLRFKSQVAALGLLCYCCILLTKPSPPRKICFNQNELVVGMERDQRSRLDGNFLQLLLVLVGPRKLERFATVQVNGPHVLRRVDIRVTGSGAVGHFVCEHDFCHVPICLQLQRRCEQVGLV